MFRRILHIPFAAWLGAGILFGMLGGNKLMNEWVASKPSTPATAELKCNVPYNYCDPSIKSLEQELKLAFNKADKCEKALGKDGLAIRDKIILCEKDVKLWRARAEQIKLSAIKGFTMAETCNENLNICVNTLKVCSAYIEQIENNSLPGE